MESVPEDQLGECNIYFLYSNSRSQIQPWIKRLFAYEVEGSEGMIEFDGHYYVSDEEFPTKLLMSFSLKEKEGFTKEDHPGSIFYNIIRKDDLLIEVHRREKIECTDKISKIIDQGGEEMDVCFFPTDRQKIYFHIKGPLGDKEAEDWFFEGCS